MTSTRRVPVTVRTALYSLWKACNFEWLVLSVLPDIREQPKRRTSKFGPRSFSYVGDKVWNELPTYLNETTDLNNFKSQWLHGMKQIFWIQHSLIRDILCFDIYIFIHCLILCLAPLFFPKHCVFFISFIYVCVHIHTTTSVTRSIPYSYFMPSY